MKKEKQRESGIEALRLMHEELSSGKARPARAYISEKRPDGSVSIREVDPEKARKKRERIYNETNDVARIRQKTGMSQSEFAGFLGISIRTLQSWERNASKPSGAAATLLRIVEARPEVLEALND
jgi:putative transcriptional regulator